MMFTYLLFLLSSMVALVHGDCGSPSITPDTSKIVGGKDAIPGSWPWQGYLEFKETGWWGHSEFAFVCGGSLIAPNWFMVAAHCVSGDSNPKDFRVTLGVYDRNANEASQQTPVIASINKNLHFDSYTYKYDIALIEFVTPVQIGARVSTVCLPADDSEALSPGNSVIVTGWGSQSSGGAVVSTLRQVTVPIVPYSVCNGTAEYDGKIFADCMFCAGVGGKDSCQGDSGGPAVAQDATGKWFQYGIVSWGYGCANAHHPGVYSRVNDYCSFIQQTTGLDLCQ